MEERFDPETAGAEIERLVQALAALHDTAARAQVQELVRLLMALYGAGMQRMLDIVRTESGGTSAMIERFASDGLISSLLVLHDLHPHAVDRRVTRALELLQPHLPSGLGLTLVDASERGVHVRVDPPASRSAAAGLRASLERAIREAAPEVADIQIDGVQQTEPLIQIQRGADVLGAHERR